MAAAKSWDEFEDADTRNPLEKMPEGKFTGKITKRVDGWFNGSASAAAGRTLTLTYEIVTPAGDEPDPELAGRTFVKKVWLNSPEKAGNFLKALKNVGFDTDSWGAKDSPFPKSTMVPLALKYLRLKDVVLQLAKKNGKPKAPGSPERWEDEVYINGRVLGEQEAKTIPNADVLAVADEPESAEEMF